MMVILNLNTEIFIVYILVLEIKIKIYIDFLDKITILVKYFNNINVFLPEFIAKFLKYNNNNYAIECKKK